MKNQSKKIIAREFLILILTILLSIVAFSFTYLYNSYHVSRIENISNIINSKRTIADSLINLYNNKIEKQKWFYDNLNELFDLGEYNTFERLWVRQLKLAKLDSLKWKWEDENFNYQTTNLKKIGFVNDASVKDFIMNNTITNLDSNNQRLSVVLIKEIKVLTDKKNNHQNKVLNNDDQINFAKYSLYILLIILFIIRYVMYGIIWSIKVLKEKTD